jgi:hypothetical protein
MNIYEIINSQYSLILFIIIAFSYNIVVYRSNLVIIVMFVIILYLMYLYDFQNRFTNKDFKNIDEIITDHSQEFINKELELIQEDEYYIDSNDIYSIYKKPKKFLFLKKDKYLEKILYDLRFIQKYDKGDYLKLIILIENFLKTYYNLIIDRYDIDYIDILLDIRKEILNIMYNFKVDAPQYDKKKRYVHNVIQDNIVKMQSYTYQKIKNINKKYPNVQVKSPNGITKKDIYDNYKIIV